MGWGFGVAMWYGGLSIWLIDRCSHGVPAPAPESFLKKRKAADALKAKRAAAASDNKKVGFKNASNHQLLRLLARSLPPSPSGCDDTFRLDPFGEMSAQLLFILFDPSTPPDPIPCAL